MLGRYWKVLMASTILWTAALALGVFGSIYCDVRMLFWGAILALLGHLTTAFFVALCASAKAVRLDRIELEHLAAIMARVGGGSDDVTPIR